MFLAILPKTKTRLGSFPSCTHDVVLAAEPLRSAFYMYAATSHSPQGPSQDLFSHWKQKVAEFGTVTLELPAVVA